MNLPAWSDVVHTLRLEQLYGILLSILLGGVIGLERELKGKVAGLRTNILICMGAALFTQLSMSLASGAADRGRIAAQIVTGVGFLGAGTILHGKGSITGLTSAATIWLVAAIGAAVGAGEVYLAGGTTLIAILILAGMDPLERYISKRAGASRVTVSLDSDPRRIEEVEALVRQAGVEIEELHSETQGDRVVVTVKLRGPKHAQDKAKLSLLRASGTYTLSVED